MIYSHITIERLKEIFTYDEKTGEITWKIRPFRNSRKKAGDKAGVLKKTRSGNYLYIGFESRSLLGTQVAFALANGRWAARQVGVKNGNPSDLRKDNLVEMRTASGDHDFTTKEGMSKYRKKFLEENFEYIKGLSFKRYYGITFGDFRKMFDDQGGVCAICGNPETTVINGKVKWLSVDHCHDTDKVRGLLCHHCNHGLGHFFDKPENLRRAADYLERQRV